MNNDRHGGRPVLIGLVIVSLVLATAGAGEAAGGIGRARETFVDASRPTRASPPFPGAPDRRLDTWIWYPAEGDGSSPVPDADPRAGGPWPLVVYSHGTYGRPDNATHFIEHLAHNGYVVAAPAFPLTSSVAHTRLPAADVTDAGSQPGDASTPSVRRSRRSRSAWSSPPPDRQPTPVRVPRYHAASRFRAQAAR